jgi:hypothetical protein
VFFLIYLELVFRQNTDDFVKSFLHERTPSATPAAIVRDRSVRKQKATRSRHFATVRRKFGCNGDGGHVERLLLLNRLARRDAVDTLVEAPYRHEHLALVDTVRKHQSRDEAAMHPWRGWMGREDDEALSTIVLELEHLDVCLRVDSLAGWCTGIGKVFRKLQPPVACKRSKRHDLLSTKVEHRLAAESAYTIILGCKRIAWHIGRS